MPLPPSAAARRPVLRPRVHVLAVVVTLASLTAGAAPAVGQPADPEAELERVESERAGLERSLRDAEAEQAGLSRSLQAATARVDRLEAQLAEARDRADALAGEVTGLEARNAAALEVMGERLRRLYMGQAVDDLVAVAAAESVRDVGLRSQYLAVLSRRDRADAEAAAALAGLTEARRAQLAEANAALDRLVGQAQQARAALDRELAAAGALTTDLRGEVATHEAQARRLRAEAAAARREAEEARAAAARQAGRKEAARKAALAAAAERRAQAASRSSSGSGGSASDSGASATSTGGSSGGGSSGGGSSGGPVSGGMACPQAAPRSFTDTWGAPRSGGRTHQGTDIFGRMGGEVYAITGGRVEWTNTGATSGLFLSLRGDDGHRYWYMHLSSFVAGAGQRVKAGQLIARNGNTGNAAGMTPHIHFEYHPGGGGAVNPYPLLKRICG